jgi:hypothetical protein
MAFFQTSEKIKVNKNKCLHYFVSLQIGEKVSFARGSFDRIIIGD